MKVCLTSENPALKSIFNDPKQIVTLDANFLIPPDRHRLTTTSFDFPRFQHMWLDPIFQAFPNLAIHEAVYDELVSPAVKLFVQTLTDATPPRLIIHRDSTLTPTERVLRDSIEEKIYPLTQYDPLLNNKDDRGEVKTLAYIAVKGLPYFAAHDSNALQLVKKAEEWSTGLDNIQPIRMYELVYYLYTMNLSEKRSLRVLYKYQYHLTKREKEINPEWGLFIKGMDKLYNNPCGR